MLAQFHASYQRVEQSLQRLTDSIAAYNPSPAAADELVAADDVVNEQLEHLTHQQNHLRIQELRRTTESLDETIKNTVRLLADTRKEILAIPSSITTSEPRREVKVDELLSYAKFISKTTVPPTFRKPTLDNSFPKHAQTDDRTQAQITNGIATPPHGAQSPAHPPLSGSENPALKTLPPESKAWLHPLNNLTFEPWPSHDVIQASALAEIQRLAESGVDPASVLSAEERAEAEKRKREEEARERVEQEERVRRRFSLVREAGRRGTVAEEEWDPDEA